MITRSDIIITYPTRLQNLTQNNLALNSCEKTLEPEHVMPRHQVWELEYFLPHYYITRTYYLNLKIANQVWCIKGTREEVRWLVGELSHYLQIPAISITPSEAFNSEDSFS